ncbi:helix-turn-helix transcriptional regulator [Deinococcus sp. JMULE3]|uniref:helix-turn-helix transcriptional regulator n=1 Tax=Deinococcus sp. JMULE3 TaxID=2518341 RepID=UPI00157526DC|nr:helix-turn-helix transcriptional regulator [Deinococcus sp. JMULE3]NTX99240.1 XRE family transcriptional regulator [Deinococcus sp. JMULE3]
MNGNIGVREGLRKWTVENTAHLRQPRQLNPDKLIAARLAAGIDTQWQMADLIGMTRGRYNRWEQPNPPTNLPHRIVAPMLTILGVQWDDISDPIP